MSFVLVNNKGGGKGYKGRIVYLLIDAVESKRGYRSLEG